MDYLLANLSTGEVLKAIVCGSMTIKKYILVEAQDLRSKKGRQIKNFNSTSLYHPRHPWQVLDMVQASIVLFNFYVGQMLVLQDKCYRFIKTISDEMLCF